MNNPEDSYNIYIDAFSRTKRYTELWLAGLCKLKLGDFENAYSLFHRAIDLNIVSHQKSIHYFPWEAIYLIALTGDLEKIGSFLPQLLEFMKNSTAPYSPLAIYSYLFVNQFSPVFNQSDDWISKLISFEKRKIIDIYTLGYCYTAIHDRDNEKFNNNILLLLQKHERIAKFGQLRETSEGYFCMDAVGLCFCALMNKMIIPTENNFLPNLYLEWIIENKIGKRNTQLSTKSI
jgi:hypothetical protein